MVLVTCAAGRVGRQIVPYLTAHGKEVRAFDISDKVNDYVANGQAKEAMTGDGSNDKDLDRAMTGVDQVVYIPPQFTYIEDKMGKMAIDAAIRNGVKQFIDLSVLVVNLDYKVHHKMKENVERHLMYRGYEHPEMMWTVLRPAAYHHNIFLKQFYDLGLFPNYSPIDKKMSWLDARDEADVILKVLDNPKEFNHGSFDLCNQTVSAIEVAQMMSDATGKDIKALYCDEKLQEKYWPSYFHGGDSYSREAFNRIRTSYDKWGWDGCNWTLRHLLDHEPRTLEAYLSEEAEKLGIQAK